MAKNIKVWFDREADLLEVTFDGRAAFMRPTADDDVMARIAEDTGEVIGFMVFGVVARHGGAPLNVSLDSTGPEAEVVVVKTGEHATNGAAEITTRPKRAAKAGVTAVEERPASKASRANVRFVSRNPKGGWDVRKAGAARASSHHGTKTEAIVSAREVSRNKGAELTIHGRIVRSGSHGHDPRAPRG